MSGVIWMEPPQTTAFGVLPDITRCAAQGQKRSLTRVWARRCSRPRVPQECQYECRCLFLTICSLAGKAVDRICDRASIDELNRQFLDISAKVADRRHAPVALDGADWHRSKKLLTPSNFTLLRLPTNSSELNPMETVFQYLKACHFTDWLFEDNAAASENSAAAREEFTKNVVRIRSLGARSRAMPAGGMVAKQSAI